MNSVKKDVLDAMVSEVLGNVQFNPETNDLTSLYDLLEKELPF